MGLELKKNKSGGYWEADYKGWALRFRYVDRCWTYDVGSIHSGHFSGKGAKDRAITTAMLIVDVQEVGTSGLLYEAWENGYSAKVQTKEIKDLKAEIAYWKRTFGCSARLADDLANFIADVRKINDA